MKRRNIVHRATAVLLLCFFMLIQVSAMAVPAIRHHHHVSCSKVSLHNAEGPEFTQGSFLMTESENDSEGEDDIFSLACLPVAVFSFWFTSDNNAAIDPAAFSVSPATPALPLFVTFRNFRI